nr:nucleoid-structuring protein H-NS [Campylobacter sputorum]
MNKLSSAVFLSATLALASDPITIDSVFKKQVGLRSVTTLSFLSSGNPNVYSSYPSLMINGDPMVWDDTKQLTLSQSIMYTLTDKIDILATVDGNYRRSEYMSYYTLEPKSETNLDFGSAWIGLNYTGDSIGELIPMVTLQTAVLQRERAYHETENFNFKSYSLKGTLKGYSDLVIYSMYTELGIIAQEILVLLILVTEIVYILVAI